MSAIATLAQHMTNTALTATPDRAVTPAPAKRVPARVKAPPARPKAPAKAAPVNPVYNPLTPLSGNALKSAIQAEVAAQVKPQTDALNQQSADAKASYDLTSGRAADYFKQFADAARGDISTAQGIGANALGAQQGIDQNAANTLAQLRAGAQGELANDAAVRGTTAGYGADQLLGTLAQRQADLAQRGRADETAVNQRGLAGSQYAAKMPTVADMKGGEAEQSLGNAYEKNSGDIAAKRASVQATAGPLFQQLLDKARQDQFNNAITMGGLNLKQADLQATTRVNSAKLAEAHSQNQAANRLASQRIGATLRGQDLQHQAAEQNIAVANHRLTLDEWKATHPSSSGGRSAAGLTPAQELAQRRASQKQLDRVDTIAGRIKGMISASRAQGKTPNHDDMNSLLLGQGYQQWEIDAATDARHHNGLYGAKSAAAFKAHGVPIPSTWQYGAPQGKLGGLTH